MKRVSVVLTDVTEMSGDAVCIAGIDLESGRTIRLSDRTPTRQMLRGHGGLRPGDVVSVKFRSAAPARSAARRGWALGSPHATQGARRAVR